MLGLCAYDEQFRKRICEDFVMNWRNPKYNRHGTIDCEINHPQYGWIPFTASPNDVAEHGREIYSAIVVSGTPIAPYEEGQ